MRKTWVLLFIFLAIPFTAKAQELYQDIQGVWKAEVIEVLSQKTVIVPGTDTQTEVQTLKVEILNGINKGEVIEFENDYIQLEQGDKFYLNYLITINGQEIYSVREIDRAFPLAIVALIFIATILLFGGLQGFRSLLSLAGSLLVIVYVLVPSLVSGYSPVLISIAVAGAILFFAIFFTHGFNKRSLIAFLGTVIAVGITGLLAYFSIEITSLTGFTNDETVYLNLNTGGTLNFTGLLLAAIIIGSLGVLDDIAITQVAVVRELIESNSKLTRREVYSRALRVGKEHVGALVNTLVLAYTGASLPLLLLFSVSESGVLSIINREIFATEIVRSLIGSIGLILTVPITTLLAVALMYKESNQTEITPKN